MEKKPQLGYIAICWCLCKVVTPHVTFALLSITKPSITVAPVGCRKDNLHFKKNPIATHGGPELPLPPPQPRTHLHTRDVVYRGFQRADRLWDIEAEMRDTKTHAMEIPGEGTWQPGEPIHNLSIRVTIDDAFVVREIAVAMDDVPHPECPMAQAPMQTMIGCTMGAGWRHAIQRNLGGARGCTHLRELLFNMATVAFQTLPEGPLPEAIDGSPPHFVGQCLAWDVNGSVVQRHYPAFVGWRPKAEAKDTKQR